MKQTAVDWLVNEIDMQYPEINVRRKEWMVDKAKDIEREQIIRARQDGLDNGFSNGSWDSNLYYKENYEQKIERL